MIKLKKPWYKQYEYWFAIGLTLTTATQLRFPGFSLGFGETILALWTFVTIIILLKRGKIYVSTISNALVTFWISILIILIVGSMITIYLGHFSNISYRTFTAYIFISLIFVTFSFSIKQNITLQIKKISRLTFSFTTFPLLVMYIISFASSSLFSLNLINVRFSGWATNPNQIALVTAVLLFVGIYNITQAKNCTNKLWYGLLTIGLLLVGIATMSDALNVALIIGITILACLYWYNKVILSKKLSYWKGIWLKIFIPLIFISFIVIFGLSVYTIIQDGITDISDEGNQGSIRYALWKNGWEAIKVSPIFGLGTGAFSGVDDPFRGMEAHNTFIDFGTNTGLLGLMIYLLLILWTAWLAWRRNEYVLFAGIITITLYSTFHFVLRHPLYWFYLILVISICTNEESSPAQHPVRNKGENNER